MLFINLLFKYVSAIFLLKLNYKLILNKVTQYNYNKHINHTLLIYPKDILIFNLKI